MTSPYVGAATKVLGGVLGGIGGKRAAGRAAEHGGKVARSKGMISYSNYGPNSQVGQMRDRMFQSAMRTPEQNAQENTEFAKRQFADSMNLMTQRGQQNMVGRGFENMTDSQTGLQKAVLSRMMSPQTQMFADNMANQMQQARQYQTGLLGQEYSRGMQQHDDIGSMMTGGGAAHNSFNQFAQPMYAGLSGAVNYMDSRNNLANAQAMQQQMIDKWSGSPSRNRFDDLNERMGMRRSVTG